MDLSNVSDFGERIIVSRDGEVLLPACFNASSWLKRARGLIGRPPELAHGGLLLYPCNSIHNFFMRYAIDAVFLDKAGKIVKITTNFRPFYPYAGAFKACATLELLAGRAADLRLEVGQELEFQEK